jgi:hypothetical protein
VTKTSRHRQRADRPQRQQRRAPWHPWLIVDEREGAGGVAAPGDGVSTATGAGGAAVARPRRNRSHDVGLDRSRRDVWRGAIHASAGALTRHCGQRDQHERQQHEPGQRARPDQVTVGGGAAAEEQHEQRGGDHQPGALERGLDQ